MTNRSVKPVADFLRHCLANGALAVAELEARARTGGPPERATAYPACEIVQKSKEVSWHTIRPGWIWR